MRTDIIRVSNQNPLLDTSPSCFLQSQYELKAAFFFFFLVVIPIMLFESGGWEVRKANI